MLEGTWVFQEARPVCRRLGHILATRSAMRDLIQQFAGKREEDRILFGWLQVVEEIMLGKAKRLAKRVLARLQHLFEEEPLPSWINRQRSH